MESEHKRAKDVINENLSEASENLSGVVAIMDRILVDDGAPLVTNGELLTLKTCVQHSADLIDEAWDATDGIRA